MKLGINRNDFSQGITGKNGQYNYSTKNSLQDAENVYIGRRGQILPVSGTTSLNISMLDTDKLLSFRFRGETYHLVYDTLLKRRFSMADATDDFLHFSVLDVPRESDGSVSLVGPHDATFRYRANLQDLPFIIPEPRKDFTDGLDSNIESAWKIGHEYAKLYRNHYLVNNDAAYASTNDYPVKEKMWRREIFSPHHPSVFKSIQDLTSYATRLRRAFSDKNQGGGEGIQDIRPLFIDLPNDSFFYSRFIIYDDGGRVVCNSVIRPTVVEEDSGEKRSESSLAHLNTTTPYTYDSSESLATIRAAGWDTNSKEYRISIGHQTCTLYSPDGDLPMIWLSPIFEGDKLKRFAARDPRAVPRGYHPLAGEGDNLDILDIYEERSLLYGMKHTSYMTTEELGQIPDDFYHDESVELAPTLTYDSKKLTIVGDHLSLDGIETAGDLSLVSSSTPPLSANLVGTPVKPTDNDLNLVTLFTSFFFWHIYKAVDPEYTYDDTADFYVGGIDVDGRDFPYSPVTRKRFETNNVFADFIREVEAGNRATELITSRTGTLLKEESELYYPRTPFFLPQDQSYRYTDEEGRLQWVRMPDDVMVGKSEWVRCMFEGDLVAERTNTIKFTGTGNPNLGLEKKAKWYRSLGVANATVNATRVDSKPFLDVTTVKLPGVAAIINKDSEIPVDELVPRWIGNYYAEPYGNTTSFSFTDEAVILAIYASLEVGIIGIQNIANTLSAHLRLDNHNRNNMYLMHGMNRDTYYRAVEFHDARMILGGSRSDPSKLVWSRLGVPTNFPTYLLPYTQQFRSELAIDNERDYPGILPIETSYGGSIRWMFSSKGDLVVGLERGTASISNINVIDVYDGVSFDSEAINSDELPLSVLGNIYYLSTDRRDLFYRRKSEEYQGDIYRSVTSNIYSDFIRKSPIARVMTDPYKGILYLILEDGTLFVGFVFTGKDTVGWTRLSIGSTARVSHDSVNLHHVQDGVLNRFSLDGDEEYNLGRIPNITLNDPYVYALQEAIEQRINLYSDFTYTIKNGKVLGEGSFVQMDDTGRVVTKDVETFETYSALSGDRITRIGIVDGEGVITGLGFGVH